MRLPKETTRQLSRCERTGAINAGIGLAVCVLATACFYVVAQVDSGGPTELSPADGPSAGSLPHQTSVSDVPRITAMPGSAEAPASTKKTAYPITIRTPTGPPQVFTGITDPHGNAVTVSCSTCHATRKPDFSNRNVTDLNEFHGSLKLSHGTVSCLSCHNASDYDALKLADGTRVEFPDVMQLCGQCHGQQMRDYEHNVHGGMNGYWDLNRGPRQKNNCIDCHNPHSPQFPRMQPTFKPQDRFLEKPGRKQ